MTTTTTTIAQLTADSSVSGAEIVPIYDTSTTTPKTRRVTAAAIAALNDAAITTAQDAADAAQEKSKVGLLWNSSQPSEKTAIDYRKAVEARDRFQREQIRKQLNLATTAPEFPGKAAIVENLKKELELFPEPEAPKEQKPEASKPAAKAEPTAAPAKPGVPSNKPAAKLTPEQNNAAIAKANEAIKNGADPAKVKARLKEAGVSFKEE